MKSETPTTQFSCWRNEHLFNIDFACYSFSKHSFPRHFHDHYVIQLVLKGADRFYCGGKTFTAYDNQLVFINPGEVHTGGTLPATPLQYFSFYPDKKALLEVADALHMDMPSDCNFRICKEDHSLLSVKLKTLYQSFSAGTDMLQQQELFFDGMHELLKYNLKKPGKADNNILDLRVKKLKEYIAGHFREDISLQKMSQLVHINPFHLVRMFKKNTGLSPYDYLLIVRTEYAKRLLHQGYPVHEAARSSGFYDTSHLNRSVRKIAATSPKSFLLSKGQYRTFQSH